LRLGMKTMIKKHRKHECGASTGFCGAITFGTGELDDYGYWEYPCDECARDWEKKYPEYGECWPYKSQKGKKMYGWEIKEYCITKTTDLLIWLLQKINRYKNEPLSYRLHRIADRYARRPTGDWE